MTRMLTTLFASTLLAAPALAQTDAQDQTTQQTGQQQTGQTACDALLPASMTEGGDVADLPEIVSMLEDNGFSDVDPLEASYLISSTTPQGECVVTMVNAEITGDAEMASTGDAQAADEAQAQEDATDGSAEFSMAEEMSPEAKKRRAESMAETQRQMEEQGSTDIRLVDAAYVLRAKGPEGRSVLMMIDGAAGGTQQN